MQSNIHIKWLCKLATVTFVAIPLVISPASAEVDDDDDDNGTGSTVHLVNCDRGRSIQNKLDIAKDGDTVLVSGYCVENINIDKDRIKLIAKTSGATITAATNDFATIRVRGSQATVSGFTIVGGRLGIQLLRGGSAVIESNDISGATSTSGILLTQNSYAQIGSNASNGNTIHHNATAGINIRLGSSAMCSSTTYTIIRTASPLMQMVRSICLTI